MSKLGVESFTISLDGFGAGPDQDINNPLGIGGTSLHAWALCTRTFQKNLFGSDGGSAGIDEDFAARRFQNIGAWILGRNMFGPVRRPSPDESWRGWWGPAGFTNTIHQLEERILLARPCGAGYAHSSRGLRGRMHGPTSTGRRWSSRATSPSTAAPRPPAQVCRSIEYHVPCTCCVARIPQLDPDPARADGGPADQTRHLGSGPCQRFQSRKFQPLCLHATPRTGARVVQSCIHLASTSAPAVSARFAAFAVQVGIAVYWAIRLHGT